MAAMARARSVADSMGKGEVMSCVWFMRARSCMHVCVGVLCFKYIYFGPGRKIDQNLWLMNF